MKQACGLCAGTGENRSGLVMLVNNDICPRCGGYGEVPVMPERENGAQVTAQDLAYAKSNGMEAAK